MKRSAGCNTSYVTWSEQQFFQLLFDIGAVTIDGHFIYTGGKHGSTYINKDAIYPHTDIIRGLCHVLARKVEHLPIEVVVGPAVGGIVLAYQMAVELQLHLGIDIAIAFAYAEKGEGGFLLNRGFDRLVANKNVLIAEDTLTTGFSAAQVAQAVRLAGGKPFAVGALFNRGKVTAEQLSVAQLYTLLDINFVDIWDPAECPLCLAKIPINTTLGKGRTLI